MATQMIRGCTIGDTPKQRGHAGFGACGPFEMKALHSNEGLRTHALYFIVGTHIAAPAR